MAPIQAGMFLRTDDSTSNRYFDPNNLRFLDRELFGQLRQPDDDGKARIFCNVSPVLFTNFQVCCVILRCFNSNIINCA